MYVLDVSEGRSEAILNRRTLPFQEEMRDRGVVRLVGFLRAGQSLFWYINNG